jgi:cytochrome b6-f complex iron-sulfur subunit
MKLEESLVTRRVYLQSWAAGLGALAAGQAAWPFLCCLAPREEDGGPAEVTLPMKDVRLPPDGAAVFAFGRRPGLLLRTGAGEWVALSAVCTHFECTVHFDPASRQILCPCHKGVFDTQGRNLAGPPPRPLERYDVREGPDGLVISRRKAE